MARIAGVDIPREKRLEIALTYIFGIGKPTAQKICADTRARPRTPRCRNLTEDEVNQIRAYVDQNLTVEGDLRRDVQQDIKRKIEIGCYQGIRHRKGLPVRGQRTHTNARTRKGPKQDRCQQEEGSEEVMAKPKPGGRRPRKRERKNVTIGVVHIKSSFNNTIVIDHRHRGQRHRVGVVRWRRLQGLAQEHAVRRPAGRREGRPRRHGARPAPRRGAGEGPGFGPRHRRALASRTTGIEVTSIKDVTPVPHNGCRQPKRRRT